MECNVQTNYKNDIIHHYLSNQAQIHVSYLRVQQVYKLLLSGLLLYTCTMDVLEHMSKKN